MDQDQELANELRKAVQQVRDLFLEARKKGLDVYIDFSGGTSHRREGFDIEPSDIRVSTLKRDPKVYVKRTTITTVEF